ncbi:amidohydrolase family protein [Rhodococcus ruber]|uniref:Amidohydrolase family protein n=1 Tax=Rhodococcus ruber TaxID=1830 RepID=A0ABT4MD72_9NOCA|nr:amidohydrolase family protein [Rhodococcus ruber]MCZ4518939.1 amidohydrolase family protein [Rhodococcus ruber]
MTSTQKQVAQGQQETVDLVLAAGAVITVDPGRQIIIGGAVAVAGSKIVAVGKRADVLAQYKPARLIDRPNGILTPGLVDSHSHPAGAYLIRGTIDELPAIERLTRTLMPHEDDLRPDEAYVASMATFAEMIRHGTTTFIDAGGPQTEQTAAAAAAIGIRGVLAPQMSDLPGPFERKVLSASENLAHADELFARFDGAADGRLKVFYDLDHPLSVTDELLAGVVEHARANNTGIVGHYIGRKPLGEIPEHAPDLARYERSGILDHGIVLGHLGWIPEADVQRLAASASSVAHCPSSSMLGAHGNISKGAIPEFVAAGGLATLGTDGAAISRFLDLVRVMYLAAATHKDVRTDPSIMPATTVFEMATINGAKAARWEDTIGSIEVGKAADLVMFDASGLTFAPNRFADPVNDIVYASSGSDVETVLIDGRVVMDEGKLLSVDLPALVADVDAAAASSLGRLGREQKPSWPIV